MCYRVFFCVCKSSVKFEKKKPKVSGQQAAWQNLDVRADLSVKCHFQSFDIAFKRDINRMIYLMILKALGTPLFPRSAARPDTPVIGGACVRSQRFDEAGEDSARRDEFIFSRLTGETASIRDSIMSCTSS